MTELQIGIAGILLLFVLLGMSMPVAFAMTLVGVIGFACLTNNPAAALQMMAVDYYDTLSGYSLTVIPLFIFMGQVAFHSGISRKLDLARGGVGPIHLGGGEKQRNDQGDRNDHSYVGKASVFFNKPERFFPGRLFIYHCAAQSDGPPLPFDHTQSGWVGMVTSTICTR